jgi:Toastrack DUF4097
MLKMMFSFAGAFLFSTIVAAVDFSDTTEKTFEVSQKPELILRNHDGEIQISPHEGSTVQIKVTKKVRGARNESDGKKEADRVSVDLEQVGNQIRAITRWPHEGIRIGWHPSVDIRFEVLTPAHSDITAEVSDGELSINGIDGLLDLNTSDGEIVANDLTGNMQISASDGNVTLKHSSGKMQIKLSDGDLRAENCSGQVRIESGDGNVELPGFNGEAEISNGDGEVFVDGVLQSMNGRVADGDMTIKVAPGSIMQTDWSLRAGDGSIVLDLPDDFSANLEVTTGDGEVRTDHPVSIVGPLSTHHLNGKIRNGGHLLQIKTSDGDVDIK